MIIKYELSHSVKLDSVNRNLCLMIVYGSVQYMLLWQRYVLFHVEQHTDICVFAYSYSSWHRHVPAYALSLYMSVCRSLHFPGVSVAYRSSEGPSSAVELLEQRCELPWYILARTATRAKNFSTLVICLSVCVYEVVCDYLCLCVCLLVCGVSFLTWAPWRSSDTPYTNVTFKPGKARCSVPKRTNRAGWPWRSC